MGFSNETSEPLASVLNRNKKVRSASDFRNKVVSAFGGEVPNPTRALRRAAAGLSVARAARENTEDTRGSRSPSTAGGVCLPEAHQFDSPDYINKLREDNFTKEMS